MIILSCGIREIVSFSGFTAAATNNNKNNHNRIRCRTTTKSSLLSWTTTTTATPFCGRRIIHRVSIPTTLQATKTTSQQPSLIVDLEAPSADALDDKIRINQNNNNDTNGAAVDGIFNNDIENKEQQHENKNDNDDGDINAFELMAARAGVCLVESDMRRDAIGKAAGSQASSATNWIHDASAFALQQVMNRVYVKMPEQRTGSDRDEAAAWLRWIKTVPAPMLIDVSHDVRQVVQNQVVSNVTLLQLLDYSSPDAFLQRLFGRLIILPSGMALPHPLSEPPASIIYGKLLFGGVTRYRLLVSSSGGGGHRNMGAGDGTTPFSPAKTRRAGERKEICSPAPNKNNNNNNNRPTSNNVPVWMQYGGPDRMYEAVDMGAAAILEIGMLPRGKTHVAEHLLLLDNPNIASGSSGTTTTSPVTAISQNMIMMSLAQMAWKPQNMFALFMDDSDDVNGKDPLEDNNNMGYTPMSMYGQDRNEAFRSDFRSQVGGLQPQIDAIVRRVLDGRVIRPAEPGESFTATLMNAAAAASSSKSSTALLPSDVAKAAMEAEELALLGLSPVRGLLLYGPPGCGKTALAREISKALRARAPKIVSAPELLDRWVGGSERLIRELFANAEAELAACQGDVTKSALHVIVIDEIDAVFRKRSGSTEDSGEATRASAVNQILAKLDGVKAIPNVLLIGMTNRRELLDEALLRPGRLEVQIEIPLPNQDGRREILQIHFDALRKNGRLSRPLCCAIDGVRRFNHDVDEEAISNEAALLSTAATKTTASPLVAVQTLARRFRSPLQRQVYDLAADYATGGFSGADIAGLVRCAGSIALARARKSGSGIEGLLITLEDVKAAMLEIRGKSS